MKSVLVAVEPREQSCSACAVRAFSVCASLDKTEIGELRAYQPPHPSCGLRNGVRAGGRDDVVYNVLDGVLRLYKLLPDGRRQIVGFALPGDFLGMATAERHGFSADAIGPASVCQFTKATFARFAEHRPHLLRRINELAVRELNQAREHMVLLGRRSAEEKVATFLVGWRDRLQQFRGPSRVVPLPMNRQDIADYLGLTIETVSRTFTKFEREGVIDIVPGGICLLDAARAEALAAA